MDLIDRKAAIEAMYDFMVCGSFAFLQCGGDLEEKIKSVPSIPAVPLEPLCEWLGTNARFVRPDGSRWNLDWMKWKEELEKWMEGLHAAD